MQQPKEEGGQDAQGGGAQPPLQQQQQQQQPLPQYEDTGNRELKVEDALSYLDEVKEQFKDRPEVYNQFLDIMKEFKAQTIDTPGVIQRVSNLFRGNDRLIYGFNTFLPPDFKIPPPGVGGYGANPHLQQQMQKQHMQQQQQQHMQQQQQQQHYQQQQQQQQQFPQQQFPQHYQQGHEQYQQQYQQQQMMQQVHHQQFQPQQPYMQPQHSQMQQGGNQPVEFDRAIHYVTTIKKRFVAEPDTYKAFLEILHEYQKNEKSIEEVLERVSGLFHMHQDLLREFTFFLPEGVQEQAKRQLSRTHGISYANDPPRRRNGGGGRSGRPAPTDDAAWPQGKKSRSRKRNHSALDDDDEETRKVQVHASDRRFFRQIKSRLASRSLWDEFLKTLALATQVRQLDAEHLPLLRAVPLTPLSCCA